MIKPNRQNGYAQIDSKTARLILRTSGVSAEIAYAAKVSPSYVSRVLHGKPASGKLRKVIVKVLLRWARHFDNAAFRQAAANVAAANDAATR
jgi:hypothetical protein